VDGARRSDVGEAEGGDAVPPRRRYQSGAADHTEVLSVGKEQVEVPFGYFRRTVMTRDYSPLEPKVSELWFYARGVGGVLSLDISDGDHREELVHFERGT
jgi:hypothetical protein